MRREREAEQAVEGAQRERLAADAFEENRGAIERLRGAVRDLHAAPAGEDQRGGVWVYPWV